MSAVIKDAIRTKIQAAREASAWMLEGLAREAKTDAQKELQAKHGTPYEFGEAMIRAIGMVSIGQAKAAIDEYRAEWEAAGR